MRIAGTVRFPPSYGPAEIAVVRVTLREGDGGPVVAEVGLPFVSVPADGLELPFALETEREGAGPDLVLHAHADRAGSGDIASSDLVARAAPPADEEEAVVLLLGPVD